MKILILILFLFCWVNLNAQTLVDGQSYSRKDAIISASILGATFISAETFRNQINGYQAMVLNMSGIGLSVGYSLFKTTKLSKNIEHRLKMRRNKKIKVEILICER